ncbi:hypothetical protein GCM10010344_51070 [Streptomyces bluensis]|nr:hypothetical protein GCM10010344_51070 [Streptomyces bluensis]
MREVKEVTRFRCGLGPRLPTAHDLVNGRRKQVRYWMAEAGEWHFAPNHEVDRVSWLAPGAARGAVDSGALTSTWSTSCWHSCATRGGSRAVCQLRVARG